MCRYANVQMPKSKMCECADVQNVQMPKVRCANVQMCKCADDLSTGIVNNYIIVL